MKTLGCGVLISSDCHKKEFLDANFESGKEYIQSCGFNELLIFDGKRFVGEMIK
jgi:histidinol phosphatase-like PHP family hydrolase